MAASLHRLYGLTIESELTLAEAARLGPPDGAADVSIRIGRVDEDGIARGRRIGPYLWAAPRELWLDVPGIARFSITNGDSIVVDPAAGADEDSVRVFLLGSVLGALLHQRGMFVLHGTAVAVGDRCLVCVGPSGAGKSTVAAAFLRRGHRVLADDIVPVDGDGRVTPGLPRLELWNDALSRLGIDTNGLRPIRPGVLKFNCVLGTAQYSPDPLPLTRIYELVAIPQRTATITPVRGVERLRPLVVNTYRHRLVEGMGLQANHFRLGGSLAQHATVRVVTRTADTGPDDLADLLLADFEHDDSTERD